LLLVIKTYYKSLWLVIKPLQNLVVGQ